MKTLLHFFDNKFKTFFVFVFLMIGFVTVGQTTITTGNTVAASTITAGNTVTINAGGTLDMDVSRSFASITTKNSGTSSITGSGTLTTGTLTIDPPNSSTNTLTIASATTVVCTSIVKGGTGNGASSYALSVSGTLQNSGTTSLNTFTCNSGSTVDYSGASQNVFTTTYYNLTLSGSGTKTFGSTVTINNNLDIKTSVIAALGAGLTHPAKVLLFNGVQQVAGTWGYTGSGATNINTTFFSNTTGKVNVSGRFYSNGSNAPNLTSSWKANRDGTGASPSNFTTAGQEFYVQSGHTMTGTTTWTVSGTGTIIDVESGGALTASSTATWSISGLSTKVQIENGGTLTAASAITLAAATTFQIDNGGTYKHQNTGAWASTIFTGTEVFGNSSTVELNSSNSTGPTGVTFGNLIVNFTSDPGGSLQFSGAVTTINGDFTILNTNIRELRLTSATTFTLNIAGDLIVSGGTVNVSSGAGVATINVGGNFTHTAGTITESSTGSGTILMNGSGAITIESIGLTNSVDFTVAPTGAGTVEIPVTKTFVDAGSSLFSISNTSSATELTVNGTLNRTSSAVPVPTGTLSFSSTGKYISNFSGGSIPTATWNAASILQIDASIADNEFTESFGIVNVNGSSAFNMVTGATNPTIQGKLTIATTSGTVALSNSGANGTTLSIGGDFEINGNGGTFVIDNTAANASNITKKITVAGNYIQSNGTFNLSNNPSATVTAGTRNAQLEVSGNFTHSGGTISETATDTDMITRINLLGTASKTFESTGQTGQVQIVLNKSGTATNDIVTLSANSKIDYNLTLTDGLLVLSTFNLTLGASTTTITAPGTTASMIVPEGTGEIRRTTTATGTFTYPIGDNTGALEYSPVDVNVTTGSGFSSAYIGVSLSDGKHASNNSATNFLTRSWKINQANITGCIVTVTGTFLSGASDVPGTTGDVSGGVVGSIKAAQLKGTFNQATNPWDKTGGSALSGTTFTYAGAAITAGQQSTFTGITSANPTVSITNGTSGTTCYAADVALATTFTGDPTVTYSWSPSTFLSSTTIANPVIVDPTSNVTYTVTLKDGNGISTSSNFALTTNGTLKTYNGGWSPSAPGANDGALIMSSFTTAGNGAGDITACTLTVNNSANVIIASKDKVTINETLKVTAPATLTFNNNASLFQTNATITNTDNIIIKRDSNPLIRFDYTLWSSPVTGQNLFAFSPLTSVSPNIRFYTYNNAATPNPVYVPVSTYATTDFATGRGYLIRMPFDHPTGPTGVIWTGTYTGVPNNGTQNIAITDSGDRFNLVGNPYPSPISISSLVNTYNSGNIESTLYFWRKTNNSASPSYCSWNAATSTFGDNGEAYTNDPLGVIQTGQGFFVQAKTGATNLVFRNEERIYDNANQFFRTSQNTASPTTTEANRIWLNMTGTTNGFSQTVVGYFTNSTLDVEDTDSKYFNDGPIQFTSTIANEDYVIQGRPVPFDANDVVPMKYKVTAAGDYTIAIDHEDGLFTGGSQIVYLRDNVTNIIHNLNSGAYTFTSEVGTFDSRFEILYQMPLHVDNPMFNANQVVIYKNEVNDFVINSGNVIMASVKVFDIRGRLLVEKKGINASQTTINVGTSNEVLLVQITSVDGEKVTKKVVR